MKSITVVEGNLNWSRTLESDEYAVKLVPADGGTAECVLEVGGQVRMRLPFDNLVKSVAQLSPEAASESERQVTALRKENAELRGKLLDVEVVTPHMLEEARAAAREATEARDKAVSELAHVRQVMPTREEGYESGRRDERRAAVRHLRGMCQAFHDQKDELRKSVMSRC